MERIPQNLEIFTQEIARMTDADQDMRRRAEENNGIIETEEDNKGDILEDVVMDRQSRRALEKLAGY